MLPAAQRPDAPAAPAVHGGIVLDAAAQDAAARGVCPHCGLDAPASLSTAPFCCHGCEAAYRLVKAQGLERYYDLRGEVGAAPVSFEPGRQSFTWLVPLVEQARQDAHAGELQLSLDLQGIHCAACVWVIDQLFKKKDGARRPGALRIDINPGLGRLKLVFEDGAFDLEGFLEEIGSFGYKAGPVRKEEASGIDGLLVRFGIAVAIAMNSMIFSLSFYFGLDDSPGSDIATWFSWGNWLLSVVSVWVGGGVFITSAWRAARRGILHLDVPIALGIIFAFVGSTWGFFFAENQVAYFDTLNIFIALMLLGRLLQRRVIANNRRRMLADESIDGMMLRRISASGQLDTIAASAIVAGDTLLIAPGELLPVDGVLLDDAADFSFEWITGEAEPVTRAEGQTVGAGAHNAMARAVQIEARESLSASKLGELLAADAPDADQGLEGGFWNKLALAYVVLVIAAAALAAFLWRDAGMVRMLEVVVAVLVVTCPCALGLATPLTFDLALANLRKRGVFVRVATFFDRALTIDKVLLDKTGTLTLGRLVLKNEDALVGLDASDRAMLLQMVLRSNHPKSRAVATALSRGQSGLPVLDTALSVEELAGKGLRAEAGGHAYKLGSAAFVQGGAGAAVERGGIEAGALVFAKDDRVLATLAFREALRHDVKPELDALRARGIELFLLSGDHPDHVAPVAESLGLPAANVHGGMAPDDKAAFIRAQHAAGARGTLMVGDGINDAPAFAAATCAGTPAVDRPAVPARADFFYLGAGIGPLADTLATAHRVRRTMVRNLSLAGAYNVFAVGLAMAGLMSPLLCAVLMPLSSVVIVVATALSFRGPRAASRSTRSAAFGAQEVTP